MESSHEKGDYIPIPKVHVTNIFEEEISQTTSNWKNTMTTCTYIAIEIFEPKYTLLAT